MSDTPQVWIGCLAAYNAGRLHGEWVDATDADEMYEAAKKIIKTSPAWQLDGHAEEWFIADYDNFGNLASTLGEYASFEKVAKIANLIEDHGQPFIAWANTLDDLDEAERFEEHYRGEWGSKEDYAMEVVDELGWGNVPPQLYTGQYGDGQINVFDELSSYLDWESIARELFQHGNYTYVTDNDGTGYVFEDEV